MDYAAWTSECWNDEKNYAAFQEEALADLAQKVAPHGIEVLRVVPNTFYFGAVLGSADGTRWLYAGIDDVRKQPDWRANVKMRRMSSQRDWKGSEFHTSTWDELGANAAKYLTAAYDDEVL